MDRIDDLLESYLTTGAVPADATELERAEIEQLAAAARSLASRSAAVDDEARASMPIARARFERFVMGERRAPAAPAAVAEGPRRRRVPVAAVVAIGSVALFATLAIVLNIVVFRQATTVSALEVGDYAQVEGVVESTREDGGELVLDVATPLGDMTVTAGDETSVVDANATAGRESLRPGVGLVIGGLVTANRHIEAQTLAVGEEREPPHRTSVRLLRNRNPDLAGRIIGVGLPAGGDHARIVVENDEGRRYYLDVDGESAAQVVRLERALDARVRVQPVTEAGGRFSLEFLDGVPAEPTPIGDGAVEPGETPPPGRPDQPRSGQPALVSVEGIVVAAEPGLITVRSRHGLVEVDVRSASRVLPGVSGLSRDQVLGGESLAGHGVIIRGGLEAGTDRVIANVILVGRAFEGVPRQR